MALEVYPSPLSMCVCVCFFFCVFFHFFLEYCQVGFPVNYDCLTMSDGHHENISNEIEYLSGVGNENKF